ncbi:OmpH family outer membrane protein [Luteithermobacter gelatinilyticus]|uniref:OmpH family outer membrane protein n=1 Tax=Luteithermobacter gelatinilyticus TaxID=2582913 RepID=UPI0011066A7E|nr:OmpH family outer membrane protein [Luteithermobacter gelatinilyticus]
MRHFTRLATVVALASTIGFMAGIKHLYAETLPKAVIAVIDTRMVRFNSAAGKDIQAQLDQIRQKFQNEIAAKEKQLKEEEESLKTQRSIMQKEAYEAKVREFQGKVVAVQREVQLKQRQMEAALVNAQNEVQRALKPILQKVLNEHGATVIMDKSLIIEQVPGLDVTTKVIEQLDQVLPTVKVELPQVEGK